MAALAVARGKLIGVRFSDEEFERVARLIAHFEQATPGVPFNAQSVIKASLAIAEAHLGLAPSNSRTASRSTMRAVTKPPPSKKR